jgi:hypothetical protein
MEKLKVDEAEARIEGDGERATCLCCPQLGSGPAGDCRQATDAHGGATDRQGQRPRRRNPGAHARETARAAGDANAPDVAKVKIGACQCREDHRHQSLGVSRAPPFVALPEHAHAGRVHPQHGHGHAAKTAIEGKDVHGAR